MAERWWCLLLPDHVFVHPATPVTHAAPEPHGSTQAGSVLPGLDPGFPSVQAESAPELHSGRAFCMASSLSAMYAVSLVLHLSAQVLIRTHVDRDTGWPCRIKRA